MTHPLAVRLAALLLVARFAAGCGDPGSNPNPDVGADTADPADTADTADTAADTAAPWDDGADPGLPPVDIAPWSRLDVDSVKRIVLWPREDRNAVATLRDDADDTGWEPEPATPSTLCIDWQPTLGRPLWVRDLTLEGSGLAGEVSVTRHRACGLEPLAPPVTGTLGRPIVIGARAGAMELRFEAAAALRIDRLEVVSTDAVPLPVEPDAAAGPGASIDGVIEGFYGVPWSWRERASIIDRIGASGMGTYVYAPKSDPLHRARWREPYDATFVDRFGALSLRARERGVRVFFGISPFIDFDDARDYPTLLGKLRAFADTGTRDFVLLADDIEGDIARPVDGTLAALHRSVVERLLADLADVDGLTLWFVPTVYSDARLDAWASGADYLAGIGRLDPRVEVLWTGTDTFAATMTGDDMARVTAALGRRPFIWDNFWANDAGDGLFGRVMLGPFAGREAGLRSAVTGIAHNPMIQGALSRLALGTFAAWRDDPARTPGALREVAAGLEAAAAIRPDPALAPLLTDIMEVFDGAANDDPAYAAYDAIPDRLAALRGFDEADRDALLAALSTLARMATLSSGLRHSAAEVDLVDDLVFGLDKARILGEAGLWRLAAMRERWAGRDTGPAEAAAAALDNAARQNRVAFSGSTPGRLTSTSQNLAPIVAAPVDPTVAPRRCSVEAGVDWPLPEGSVAVFGLAGATVRDGAVSWRPNHPGRYRVALVVVRGGASPGFGSWLGDLDCR